MRRLILLLGVANLAAGCAGPPPDAGCGDTAPAACVCRPSQNSHRTMVEHFGAAP